MLVVKITILLWVLFFIFRFFTVATISSEEKIRLAFSGKFKKMNFIRWCLIIDFLLAIIGTVASVVWFLFLR